MAATDLVFNGLSHMIGATVEVVIAGLDCGAFVVSSTGTVTVPLASIPVPTGFPDASTYFQSVDVGQYNTDTYGDATNQLTMQISGGGIATMYLPIYIGFNYPALGQGMRPANQQQTKSATGGATGKLRRVWDISLLLTNTQGLQVGTTPTNVLPLPLLFADQTPFASYQLFCGTADMRGEDSDSFDGMPFWYAPGPYPAIVNALTAFTEVKEKE
jgi:hypothetical protein